MQTASSKIWTRFTLSISYDGNHYIMSVSIKSIIVSVCVDLPNFTTSRMSILEQIKAVLNSELSFS